jgi:4-methylaminobutanoate oxidase (formaldehyde-forming)
MSMPPARADAVIVGAGAFGLSVAWWLARLGAGRVVLLDQYQPGSQASPRAAGLFKLIQADETRTRLARLAVEIVTGFEAVTGAPLAVERSGSLLIARTPEHARMLEQERAQSAAWGVELEALDGAEAARRAPALAPQGIRAAVHTPGDVYIEEPGSLMRAWLHALDALGVAVLSETPATGIQVVDGTVSAVVTPQGVIETPVVVDAAGAWSRAVASLAGVAASIVALRHQLLITEPVPGVAAEHPIVRVMDSAVYVRPARGGLMLGGFEADPLPLDL